MIKKLLIANRGEIAVRVIRTARKMGIQTVAVFSDADKDSVHSRMADSAVWIGKSEPRESYLNLDRILEAAQDSGADAIHPGYGFLSERAEFADACSAAGKIFVGPPSSAMRMLGSKSEAKSLAVSVDVPIVPGMFDVGASASQLKEAALEIGFPVMLKASAGGGGRGMRVVRTEDEYDNAFSTASDEALRSFGNGAMMVEKLIDRPRHVEVQILADTHGTVAALFERECSLQRRHQKLVEESPAPAIQQEIVSWHDMREAAGKLVKASGYLNAGTVEFIVDEKDRAFYFLEVNARLQVEHPVTEAITGLDLVEQQLRIAVGEPMDIGAEFLAGRRSAINGHAIEVRIVAEDPENGFLPSVGKITGWAEPKGPGIRVDTGYGLGTEVPRYYDSMIAKIIAHGANRIDAISRLRAALLDFHVLGIKTNVGFLLDVLDHSEFRGGHIDTGFLAREFGEWTPGAPPTEIGALLSFAGASGIASSTRNSGRAWDVRDGFRNVGVP